MIFGGRVHFLWIDEVYHSRARYWESSSAITIMGLFSYINLPFWCKLDGTTPAECIQGWRRSKLKTADMSWRRKILKIWMEPTRILRLISRMQMFWCRKKCCTVIPSKWIVDSLTQILLKVMARQTFNADPLSMRTLKWSFRCILLQCGGT